MKITGIRSLMVRDGARLRVIVAFGTSEGVAGWGEAYDHRPDRVLAPVLDAQSRLLEPWRAV